MRHKYETHGIVLSRAPVGEMSASVALLTSDIGLVYARAQSVRRSGAKLAPALATFTESDLTLVRGKEWWRVAGAVRKENWCTRMCVASARTRAARISGLLLRLVAGEASNAALFPIITGFFEALATLPKEIHESAETLAALRLLAALGLDEGGVPGEASAFTPPLLAAIAGERASYIARINRGIAASGL